MIGERIGCTRAVIDNHLTKLKKQNILRSIDRGVFELNPRLFAKGAWEQIFARRKEFDLELKVKYHDDGTREISSKAKEKE
jgi:GTP-sensing pleiotropic transcriptional regulator CodY